MKISVYIATSYDGFIAREDGSLDWLPGSDGSGGGDEDYGYHDFMGSVDVLLMGRNTFDMIRSFGSWHYTLPVKVLTHRDLQLPDWIPATTEAVSGSPEQVSSLLAESGYKHVYIDGGAAIQSFLRAGLVDELIITRIPILIGRGIALFGELSADIHLKHIKTTCYESGFVQDRHEVVR